MAVVGDDQNPMTIQQASQSLILMGLCLKFSSNSEITHVWTVANHGKYLGKSNSFFVKDIN